MIPINTGTKVVSSRMLRTECIRNCKEPLTRLFGIGFRCEFKKKWKTDHRRLSNQTNSRDDEVLMSSISDEQSKIHVLQRVLAVLRSRTQQARNALVTFDRHCRRTVGPDLLYCVGTLVAVSALVRPRIRRRVVCTFHDRKEQTSDISISALVVHG